MVCQVLQHGADFLDAEGAERLLDLILGRAEGFEPPAQEFSLGLAHLVGAALNVVQDLDDLLGVLGGDVVRVELALHVERGVDLVLACTERLELRGEQFLGAEVHLVELLLHVAEHLAEVLGVLLLRLRLLDGCLEPLRLGDLRVRGSVALQLDGEEFRLGLAQFLALACEVLHCLGEGFLLLPGFFGISDLLLQGERLGDGLGVGGQLLQLAAQGVLLGEAHGGGILAQLGHQLLEFLASLEFSLVDHLEAPSRWGGDSGGALLLEVFNHLGEGAVALHVGDASVPRLTEPRAGFLGVGDCSVEGLVAHAPKGAD